MVCRTNDFFRSVGQMMCRTNDVSLDHVMFKTKTFENNSF